jgi:hypothetical protein
MHDWQQLTDLTQNKEISIERVKISESGIAIDGSFELPPLAQLNMEDQIFVAAFVKSHGSIKEILSISRRPTLPAIYLRTSIRAIFPLIRP